MKTFITSMLVAVSLALAIDLESAAQSNAVVESKTEVATTSAVQTQSTVEAAPTTDYKDWAPYKALNDEIFKSEVLADSENAWVVAFVKPTCRSCKRLAEQYGSLM